MTESVDVELSVARYFYVRWMIGAVDAFPSFCLLTISKNRVELFQIAAHSIIKCEHIALPEGFTESLVNITADRGAQVHSSGQVHSRRLGGNGKQAAVFHGQGGLPEAEKTELAEYLRRVDHAVREGVDGDQLLVLAGVDYLTSIYRQVSKHGRLARATISGNVDRLAADQLFQHAVPIAVGETVGRREADALRIRKRRRGSVVFDPAQVLSAAHEGRLEALFVDKSAKLYGSFDVASGVLESLGQPPSGSPDDSTDDLIEVALSATVRHGGRVYAVSRDEMPVDGALAAIVRYQSAVPDE